MGNDQAEQQSQPAPLDLLRDSLAEAQGTVRAYDTKAQIVGVGYAFALGIVGRTGDWLPKSTPGDIVPILLFWGVVMAPLLLFGYVLYPTRKTAPKLEGDTEVSLRHILYVDPRTHDTLETLKRAAVECDPINEVAYELLKVSKLRELKRVRFIRALIMAAVSFSLLFAAHILGTMQ